MADPTVPLVLADLIKDLRRRVTNLENAQRLVTSSIQGGHVRVLQSDGTPVVSLGELDDGSLGSEFYDDSGDIVARLGQLDNGAEDGFELYAGDTRIIRADSRGSLDPVAYVPMVPLSTSFAVDVASSPSGYQICYQARIVRLQHKYLRMTVSMSTGSGTTGQIRLRTSSGQTSTVKSLAAGAGVTTTLYWELTANLGTPDLVLWFEVDHTGGAGVVTAAVPDLALGDFTDTATTSGVWI